MTHSQAQLLLEAKSSIAVCDGALESVELLDAIASGHVARYVPPPDDEAKEADPDDIPGWSANRTSPNVAHYVLTPAGLEALEVYDLEASEVPAKTVIQSIRALLESITFCECCGELTDYCRCNA